jgi:hypothetical protein
VSFGWSSFFFHSECFRFFGDFRYYFLFSQSIREIDLIQICLFLSTNLRLEAPFLNLRFRRNFLSIPVFKSYSFGFNSELSFPIIFLGCSVKSLLKFFVCKSIFYK